MTMAVMQVGIVRMPMRQWRMPVPVRVRLAWWRVRPVPVLMMLVVIMPMLMFHAVMAMRMVVPLGQMQP